MRRLFLALAVGVLGSTSNATANFMFDSVTIGPSEGRGEIEIMPPFHGNSLFQ